MSLATDTPPERTMEFRRSRPIAKPSDLLEYRYSHTLQLLPPLHSTSLYTSYAAEAENAVTDFR